jgi:hypothetical protein
VNTLFSLLNNNKSVALCTQEHQFCSVNYVLIAAELHLPVLTGTASHPDMQKIRITGFFFVNRLLWQNEVQL